MYMKYLAGIWLGLFTLLIGSVSAQNNDKWRAGSAYALTGKVYVLSVFIATVDNDWSKDDKLKAFQIQREACAWLQTQANIYEQKLSFEEGTFGLSKTLFFDEIAFGQGSGKESVDWVGKVLRKAGYKKNMDFYTWVKKNTTCTQATVLIYANLHGVSYAIACSNEMDKEMYFNEGCLIFSHYDQKKTMPLCAATIAHELLHVFGAWDLYTTFAQSSEKEKKARQIYSNDIMLRTSYAINELSVGTLSAWLIGWRVPEEKGFNWFRPKGY